MTAVPAEWAYFTGWSDGVTTAIRRDTDVTMDATLTALFATKVYIVNVTAGPGGSVSPIGAVSIPWGAAQTFAFLPEANHHLVSVSVDGVPVGKPPVYVLNGVVADHSINASFAIDTRKLTYVAGPGGTITGSTTQTVDYGSSGTTVTALPSTGYRFSGWSDGVATPARRDTNVISNTSVTASFSPDGLVDAGFESGTDGAA